MNFESEGMGDAKTKTQGGSQALLKWYFLTEIQREVLYILQKMKSTEVLVAFLG